MAEIPKNDTEGRKPLTNIFGDLARRMRTYAGESLVTFAANKVVAANFTVEVDTYQGLFGHLGGFFDTMALRESDQTLPPQLRSMHIDQQTSLQQLDDSRLANRIVTLAIVMTAASDLQEQGKLPKNPAVNDVLEAIKANYPPYSGPSEEKTPLPIEEERVQALLQTVGVEFTAGIDMAITTFGGLDVPAQRRSFLHRAAAFTYAELHKNLPYGPLQENEDEGPEGPQPLGMGSRRPSGPTNPPRKAAESTPSGE